MKYYYCMVMVPYRDHEGMKQYIQIKISDPIDRRRLYRGIRKMVKSTFNQTVDNDWVKQKCLIMGLNSKSVGPTKRKEIERALKNRPNSFVQRENNLETGDVPSLQDAS